MADVQERHDLRAERDKVTALLCGLMKSIESADKIGSNVSSVVVAINTNKIDGLKAWWEDHKALDARRAKEAKKAELRELKKLEKEHVETTIRLAVLRAKHGIHTPKNEVTSTAKGVKPKKNKRRHSVRRAAE
jgi:hypothetical protein